MLINSRTPAFINGQNILTRRVEPFELLSYVIFLFVFDFVCLLFFFFNVYSVGSVPFILSVRPLLQLREVLRYTYFSCNQ